MWSELVDRLEFYDSWKIFSPIRITPANRPSLLPGGLKFDMHSPAWSNARSSGRPNRAVILQT